MYLNSISDSILTSVIDFFLKWECRGVLNFCACVEKVTFYDVAYRKAGAKTLGVIILIVHKAGCTISHLTNCISGTESWIEQQPSCFCRFRTHTHLTPLRQLRSPTLALPQDMRGSCVSQAKSRRSSPHPPPHFLPVHSWFSAQSKPHWMF